jgi:SAM-dependent methyltransferase
MTMPAPASFWNNLWTNTIASGVDDPDAPTWPNEVDQRKLLFLSPRLPTTGTAVEVGCGAARLLCRIGLKRSLNLIAIDNSSPALELAARTAEAFQVQIDPRVGDALYLPLESESASVVLSGGLLEHFEDPRPVLREMMRILQPGGLLYADVVPRKVSWYRRQEASRMGRSHWMAPNVHESSFGPGDYLSWLEALGCTNLESVSCGVYPSRVASWPPVVRRRAARFLGALDGTVVADALGWYFMIAGTKA